MLMLNSSVITNVLIKLRMERPLFFADKAIFKTWYFTAVNMNSIILVSNNNILIYQLSSSLHYLPLQWHLSF